MANKYVDCDGHVMENTAEIIKLVGEPFKTTGHINPRRILPGLDGDLGFNTFTVFPETRALGMPVRLAIKNAWDLK